MAGQFQYLDNGESKTVSAEDLVEIAAGHLCVLAIAVDDMATQEIMIQMVQVVKDMAPDKLRERQEVRIETLLDAMLDFDPLDAAEARIDLRNAAKRKEFLENYPVIDAVTVHELAGHVGSINTQTVAAWRTSRKIFGLPFGGKTVYPRFQFDADGQPIRLLRNVLQGLPEAMTPWQTAFWLVSPNTQLDGTAPIDAIRSGDRAVIAACDCERREAIG